MQIHANRHLPLEGTYNIRDLGGYAAGAHSTRWRQILRADGLHRLDQEGMRQLVTEGVSTIIDLRSATELEQQPNPLRNDDAVHYHHISLFDTLAPAHPAGSDALFDLYVRALRERRQAIRDVLTVIAEVGDGIVLFHCTAGKDRTGIIAALLLANAGVKTATIIEDYALTGRMIAPMIEDILATAVAQGADPEKFRPLLACDPATMAATIAHIQDEYRSVGDYLALTGLSNDTILRLRTRLLGDT